MRPLLIALACLCLVASSAAAQVATSSSKLVWDQPAPDLATAQAYAFKDYADGAAAGTPLTPVTCTGTTSPFVCTVAFPAFTPGSHGVALTATNEAGESLKSTVFPFRFVIVPSPPQNLRSGQ